MTAGPQDVTAATVYRGFLDAVNRQDLQAAEQFIDIVERVQQADILGQMRQLYGKGLGLAGLAAMLWRL